MFDNIGALHDDEALARRATAVGAVAIGGAATVAILLGLAALRWSPPQLPAAPDEPMFEVAIGEPDASPLVAPGAPPPPPAPPRAAVAPDEPDDGTHRDEADGPIDDPSPLDAIRDVARSAARPAGDADGREGGVDGGDPNGRDGGQLGGDPNGAGMGGPGTGTGGRPRAVHGSSVRVKRRVDPTYPEAARQLAIHEARCDVQVVIDERGVPLQVAFDACPAPFRAATTDAVMRWRWYPARDETGSPQAATFRLAILYKLP
jgi:hypothetical protein